MQVRRTHTHAMLIFGTIFSVISLPFYGLFPILKSFAYLETGIIIQAIGAILLFAARIYYPRLRHAPSREDSSCWT